METVWLFEGVKLSRPSPDLYLYTDSSLEGWGAVLNDQEVYQVWTDGECSLHINNLELLAAKLSLQYFRLEIQHKVALLCSNTTTAHNRN